MNPLLPVNAMITKIIKETTQEYRFRLKLVNNQPFHFRPGQFVMLSMMGVGEAPFSLTSDAHIHDTFEICVRKVGTVSKMLHEKKIGDMVGIRGPYGTYFDTKDYVGDHVFFIAGGLGLVPLRPVILACLGNREAYENITLLYGSKNIKDMVYKNFVKSWEKQEDIDVDIILDNPEGTAYPQGLITKLIADKVFHDQTTFIICGPPIMYKFVIKLLKEKKIMDHKIWISLERHMKCGVGLCGHCRMDDVCVCQSGPVFRYDQVKGKRGAIA
ncbi:FAD/NAD(P)-binding protein [Vallitalea pronyensis]|uniref:FAD/NAD(P)-binding protein n=1 Tax=Vallitalea pronyensis TaxID=1348613 RepID=A0A8J8MME7_9FIRM|nr:FAD/NAD(P)-binding protein [Vallitalea pronyensis]QUI24527.1 FAD/NAD(P)-binding protein [Vallitalea pronyensis]